MKHYEIIGGKKADKVLMVYTGGTLGMQLDTTEGTLKPFSFDEILERIPELKQLSCNLDLVAFNEPIDSSDLQPFHWQKIGGIIADSYANYDGFVILHGTDTMAYTASVLSFMLKNLAKPVVLTGAQLPVGIPRSDARENILSALEIATAKKNGKPIFSEVLICFNAVVLRGNRGKKVESSLFAAFQSENYPNLAQIGVSIEYNWPYIKKPESVLSFEFKNELDPNIAILKLQPALTEDYLIYFLNQPNLKAVLLETYGSGNAPNLPWFVAAIKAAIKKGIIILNVSQCTGGTVKQGLYESGKHLEEAGVISGYDISTEAAAAKLMHLLGSYSEQVKEKLKEVICGEMTIQPE